MVLFVAAAEFFAFLNWVVPGESSSVEGLSVSGGPTFGLRSVAASAGFLNLALMALPIVAVIVVAKIAPALAASRLIATIALIEYGVSIAFGLITLLIGLGTVFDSGSGATPIGVMISSTAGLSGTQYLILGLLAVVLIAAAGYVTYTIFTQLGGRMPAMPHPGYGQQPMYPPPGPQYPPQPGPQYPPQPGQYPGAQ
jgi:hypothetical protein